jgi:hypothetical protein
MDNRRWITLQHVIPAPVSIGIAPVGPPKNKRPIGASGNFTFQLANSTLQILNPKSPPVKLTAP